MLSSDVCYLNQAQIMHNTGYHIKSSFENQSTDVSNSFKRKWLIYAIIDMSISKENHTAFLQYTQYQNRKTI